MKVTRRDVLDALATHPTATVTHDDEQVEVIGTTYTHALVRQADDQCRMVPLTKLMVLQAVMA